MSGARATAGRPRVGLGLRETVHNGRHRRVADGVEAGLDTGAGARDEVCGDLVGGEVGGTEVVRGVGVGRSERGGAGAERAVHEQVAGQAGRAKLRTASAGSAQFAPVADHVGHGVVRDECEQCGEVVARRRCPGPRTRARRRCPWPRRAGGSPLRWRGAGPGRGRRARPRARGGGRRGSAGPAPTSRARRRPPGASRPGRRRPARSARRRGTGRPGDAPQTASSSARVGGRRSGQFVSSQPWPQIEHAGLGPHLVGDQVEALGEGTATAQVEAVEQQPARGCVHVRVDERGRDELHPRRSTIAASGCMALPGSSRPIQAITPSVTAMAVASGAAGA